MADADNPVDAELVAAAYYRAALALVEDELLAVVRRHAARHSERIGLHLAAHAVIELTGAICAIVLEAMPDASSDIDARLGALRLHILTNDGTTRPH
jgi:hypothetical protein